MAIATDTHAPAEQALTVPRPHHRPSCPAWSPLKRVLFRFAFVYLLLCTLPFPLTHAWHLSELPEPVKSVAALGRRTAQWYTGLWKTPVMWVGQQVFGVTITVLPNSSKDTTYNYVETFCHLVLAAVLAMGWTVLAQGRTDHARLHRGLRMYVRFALASWMIVYASFKVFKVQFADPSLTRLQQSVGEMSPMRLMWTFIGASEGYTVFSGLIELFAGLLLTFRRTTLLGALLTAGIMTHVLVLNLCYDVPVKLFSFHLLLLAGFLILPDVPRLANLFLLGRPAGPVESHRLFRRPWLDRTAAAVRTALVLGFVALLLTDFYTARHTSGDLRPKPPLYGIWVVEAFTMDGQDRPPLTTDARRWERLIVERPRMVSVRRMDQSLVHYEQTIDTEARTLNLKQSDDAASMADLIYDQPQPDVLTLNGTVDGKKVRIRCRRMDESRFPLISRRFHWINERPFLR
jgi:hypothetical protein